MVIVTQLPKYLLILSLFGILISTSCSEDESPTYPSSSSYLALGDSYTIGQGVEEDERWPVILSKKLNEQGTTVSLPKIIAKTGWKTSDLQSAVGRRDDITVTYDLVSLLIGVNNQFAGRTVESFVPEFEALVDSAIVLTGDRKERVFVLSIPDYGATRFGSSRGPIISQDIANFNAECERVCAEKGILFFDITDLSRLVVNNSEFLAPDGLHYSGMMYALWVEEIYEEVQALLAQ